MGAFNRLLVEQPCSECGAVVERAYQFKYGDTWQHDYHIGEMLRWGGNDEGEQGLAAVAVECTPEQCTRCGFDEDAEYEIAIEFDVIRGVTGPTTIYRPTP